MKLLNNYSVCHSSNCTIIPAKLFSLISLIFIKTLKKINSEIEEKAGLDWSSKLYKIIQLTTGKTGTKPKTCLPLSLFTLKVDPENRTFMGEGEIRETGSGRDNNSIYYSKTDPPPFWGIWDPNHHTLIRS